MAVGGYKPMFDADGNIIGPKTISLMEDLRFQPNLQEQAFLGAAKAHRGVTYSHYEYRNIKRSGEAKTGRIK